MRRSRHAPQPPPPGVSMTNTSPGRIAAGRILFRGQDLLTMPVPELRALREDPAFLEIQARDRLDYCGEGERVLKLLLEEGLPVKQAAKLAHAITGMAKNALYELALRLKEA